MNININFYLEGTIEERVSELTTDSLLNLENKIMDSYIIHPKDLVLDNLFLYKLPDSKTMNDNGHIEIQKALGFKIGSHLHYRSCKLDKKMIEALRNIYENIIAKGIPVYMTARNEHGQEALLVGCNPITDIEIHRDLK